MNILLFRWRHAADRCASQVGNQVQELHSEPVDLEWPADCCGRVHGGAGPYALKPLSLWHKLTSDTYLNECT
jgi:hypothetical protein